MSIDDILTRGVVNILPGKDLLKKELESGKKLNIYFGIDPTATRIHLGHAVGLRKLQALSDLGHHMTFLIGDFTALIGDTSDKDSERPILTPEEIESNWQMYKKQAEKVLDFSNITVRHNSEWLSKLTFSDIISLAQNFSVGDFVGRELIRKRLQDGKHVRLDETLYPVMQGYDSYFMDTDLQLGGADQTFNMQAGRVLQKNLRHKESFVLVTDYLLGTDGRKMSKSWGNAIWLEDEPNEMYGKVMSLKDDLIEQYFLLATELPTDEIEKYKEALNAGENPKNIKQKLAFQIVTELYGENDAQKAEEFFEKTFQKGEAEYTQEVQNNGTLVKTLSSLDGMSASEVKRLKRGCCALVTFPYTKIYSVFCWILKRASPILVGLLFLIHVSRP
jgi:tyrosyl-tRNA synthetase